MASSFKSAMRERPILLSGPMVRAILDGRKSQTRRVVVMPLAMAAAGYVIDGRAYANGQKLSVYRPHDQTGAIADHFGPIYCPYGQPGDRLWVRETFGAVYMHEIGQHIFGGPRIPDRWQVVYRAGKQMGVPVPGTSQPIQFRTEWRDDFTPADGKWKPSIHMPRWASRLTLEITEVRVERIRDVSDADGIAEGYVSRSAFINSDFCLKLWHANPWVWAISFKVASPSPGENG